MSKSLAELEAERSAMVKAGEPPAAVRDKVLEKRAEAEASKPVPPPATPGAQSSEGRLSAFVVRVGTLLIAVGTLIATFGPMLTSRIDLAYIGTSVAGIGAVLAGKTAQHYTTERTALKSTQTNH